MPNPTNKDVRTTITQEEMDEADFDPEIQKAGDELLNGLEERETIYLNEGEVSKEEQPKEFDLEEDGKKLEEFLYGEDNLSETVYVNPGKQEEEQPKEFDLEEERKKLDRFLERDDNLSETIYENPKRQEEDQKNERVSGMEDPDEFRESDADSMKEEEPADEKARVLQELLDLEKKKDYMGIVEKSMDIFQRQQKFEASDEEQEATVDYVRSFYGMTENGITGNKVFPEKMEAFVGINKAMGAKRAQYAIQLGKEAVEFKEKLVSGEIKGAEKWKDDDKALSDIAGSYVASTSKTAYDMESVQNSLGIMVPAEEDCSAIAIQSVKDGANEYAKGLHDEKAEEYLKLGREANSAKVNRYGLKIVENGGKDGKTFFADSETKKTLDKMTDPKDLEKYEADNDKIQEQAKKNQEMIEKIIAGAKKNLKQLNAMQKKGHKNGDEYNNMHDALEKLSKIDPKDCSLSHVQKKLEELGDAAKEYERTHDKWYKATRGYGKDRLELSKFLQTMVKESGNRLTDMGKLSSRGVTKLINECEDTRQVINQKWEEKGGKEFALNHPEEWNKKAPKPEQHKKLNLEEMQKKVKEDAPKRESRRNSVREPAKRAEIEKTEHGVNDVMENNKSVMPGRKK